MASERSLPEILRSRAWDDRQHRKLRELAAFHIDAQALRIAELEQLLGEVSEYMDLSREVVDNAEEADTHAYLSIAIDAALSSSRSLIEKKEG